MGAFTYKAGKSAGPVRRMPAPAPNTAIDPAWGEVNTDPYAVPSTADRAMVASSLADTGVWIDQYIEELAALACKERRLLDKLGCPDLADNPHRPAAVYRAEELEAEIIERVRDVIIAEAISDRSWQFLTPDERRSTHADYWWCAGADQERLIGQAWRGMAPRHEWPAGWQIDRFWLQGLPLVVVLDLRIFKVLGYTPRPRPPSIFDDHRNDPIPGELKDELLKGIRS